MCIAVCAVYSRGRPPFTGRARIETLSTGQNPADHLVALPSPGGRGLKPPMAEQAQRAPGVALPSPGGRGLKPVVDIEPSQGVASRPPFTGRARIETARSSGRTARTAVALPSPGGRGLKQANGLQVVAGQVVALPSPGGRGLKQRKERAARRAEMSPSLHREGAD